MVRISTQLESVTDRNFFYNANENYRQKQNIQANQLTALATPFVRTLPSKVAQIKRPSTAHQSPAFCSNCC